MWSIAHLPDNMDVKATSGLNKALYRVLVEKNQKEEHDLIEGIHAASLEILYALALVPFSVLGSVCLNCYKNRSKW